MKKINSKEIEILLNDDFHYLTRAEAINRLRDNMVMIFEDLADNIEEYIEDWGLDEDYPDYANELRNMVLTKTVPAAFDWGIAEIDGKTYYIQYS